MKKFICFFAISLFVLSLANTVFAKGNVGIKTASKQLKEKLMKTKAIHQNPLPQNFNEAQVLYFKQRIDLEDISYNSKNNNAPEVKFFKIKLDNSRQYSLINLQNSEVKSNNKTSFVWKDFKGAYGYYFEFELVNSNGLFLFIKVQTFAKGGEDIPYAFAVFNDYSKEITFEALVYGENPYKGFIKKILEVK